MLNSNKTTLSINAMTQKISSTISSSRQEFQRTFLSSTNVTTPIMFSDIINTTNSGAMTPEVLSSTGVTAQEVISSTGATAHEVLSFTGATAQEVISFTGVTAQEVISSTGVTAQEVLSFTGATAQEVLSFTGATAQEVLSSTGSMTTEVLSSTKSHHEILKSSQDYLDQLNQEFTDLVLPAVIYLGILMVIGVIGNSLVLYVYTYRTRAGTITRYIQALALFDLLSCCVAMPGEIADMTQNFTFGSSPVCKAVRTVNLFCTMASGVTLVVVAVDRYKRICCPLNPQISPRGANMIIIVCTCISLGLSLPSAAIFGNRTIPTRFDFVNGTDCSISDQFIDTAFPLAYNSFQMLLFIVGAFILTVLYVFIARAIFRQAHLRRVRSRRSSMIQPMDRHTSHIPLSDRSTHSSIDPSSPEANGVDHDSPLVNSKSKENNSVSKPPRDGVKVQANMCSNSNKQNGTISENKRFDTHKVNSSFVDVDLSSNTTLSPPETPIDHQDFEYKPLIKSQPNKIQKHNLRQNGQLDEMESASTTPSCEIENDDGALETANNEVREVTVLSSPPISVDVASENTIISHDCILSSPDAATVTQENKTMTPSPQELGAETKTATNDGAVVIRINPQTPGDADSGFGDGGSQEKLRWSLTMASSASSNKRRVLFRSHSDVTPNGKGSKKSGSTLTGAVTSDDERKTHGVSLDLTKHTLAVPRRQRRRSSIRRFRPDLKKLKISDPQGTRRTTLMLFLITLIYVLSFLPHLVLMIIKATDPTSLSGGGGSTEMAHNIILRSYFINSVANPIIYSFCSRDFFTQCINPRRTMNNRRS